MGQMSAVRATKAVLHQALAFVPFGGSLAADLLIHEEADIRQWYGLPRKFLIFTANVPDGSHVLAVKCYDDKGKLLERSGQVWLDVPVPSKPGNVLYLRINRNRQNNHGMIVKKL